MKELHTTKETLSLVMTDVILALALLDKSLVRKIHVDVIMKETRTIKETLSLAVMVVIPAPVPLDK